LTGNVILDGRGDPNATFIFQAGSTLTTATASSVTLINGTQACNVLWQIGSSATLGTASTFVGSILATTSITVTTGVTITGRVLANNGAVTLDTDTITAPSCAPLVVPSANTTPTIASPPPTQTATPVLPDTGPTKIALLLGSAAVFLLLGATALKLGRGGFRAPRP
jgi:hypothetical protein